MKEEILSKLNVVINALNNVSVQGKQNLDNLSGSIYMVAEIRRILSSANITEENHNKE